MPKKEICKEDITETLSKIAFGRPNAAIELAYMEKPSRSTIERINSDSFTLDAINKTISGCGIYAIAEETDTYGKIRVTFPHTAGKPENYTQIESIILDIIPCHLLTEFYYRYLTWAECEAQGFTFGGVEAAGHTWESFEKAVPTV